MFPRISHLRPCGVVPIGGAGPAAAPALSSARVPCAAIVIVVVVVTACIDMHLATCELRRFPSQPRLSSWRACGSAASAALHTTAPLRLLAAATAAPASQPATHDAYEKLLDWATTSAEGYSGATGGGRRKVEVRELGAGRGRGLVATAEVEPGEVLLAVPFDNLFAGVKVRADGTACMQCSEGHHVPAHAYLWVYI